MANDSKRVSQLGVTTALANTDRVVVLTNPGSASANLQTITITNFGIQTANALPRANSSQFGLIKVGSGLAVSNGVLSTNNTANILLIEVSGNPIITTNKNSDISITGNNSGVNITSNNYAQMVYSQDGSLFGGGNNQTYSAVQSGVYYNYITTNDPDTDTSYWTEFDFYSNGMIDSYGFANSFSYSWSISPFQYGIVIQPSSSANTNLSIDPTFDNDIHLYESNTGGAVTLGSYGQTNFRVYGPGGANNGGGQYGNDIQALLVGNSIFTISTNNANYSWTFDDIGGFVAPYAYSNARTGAGQFFKLRNTENQKIIGTENGNSTYQTVDRLVISGGDGFDSGEGGDIYLWAGRSGDNGGSGGDIKVDAGNANNSEGGTIKIRGGSSQSSQGGFVEIWSGQGATGAPISMHVWGNSGWSEWSHRPDGVTIFPNRTITSGVGNNLVLYSTSINGEDTEVDVNPSSIDLYTWQSSNGSNHGSEIYLDNSDADAPFVYLIAKANNDVQQLWMFNSNGHLTVPGPIESTSNTGNVVITSSNGSTSHYWTFESTGTTNLPGAVVGSTTNNVYTDTTIELDVTATINKLYPQTSSPSQYHLADGVEGQIMYIVPATGGAASNEYTSLNISHARYTQNTSASPGAINEVTDAFWWLPFRTGAACLTLTFTDGYWNLPHAIFD